MDQEERLLRAFGKRLKGIREDKGISIRELADLADMNLGNLSDLELGKKNPLYTTICRLAEALEVNPSELFPQK